MKAYPKDIKREKSPILRIFKNLSCIYRLRAETNADMM